MKHIWRFSTQKISRKFMGGVVLILAGTFLGTQLLNLFFVEKFYLYQQREYVREVGRQLESEILSGKMPQEAIKKVEETEKVLIVYSKEQQDPDILSNELRDSFRQKGLGFQKFWLWDQDYTTTKEDGTLFRLYYQEQLNYSIVVQYLSFGDALYAIAAIVPDVGAFLQIINQFSFILYGLSVGISVVFLFLLTKRITEPLKKIYHFTQKLASHNYTPISVKTGDELETVANSLNEMGKTIKRYQEDLQAKNKQMQQLLSNVAHDLKTPVSLVGMYASGIKDQLDDGTFLDIILEQNKKMSNIIESLLHLSCVEQKSYPCSELYLDRILAQCIKEQGPFFENRKIQVEQQVQKNALYHGNPELIAEIFSNFLSNAAKYATGHCVKVSLEQAEGQYCFQISNQMNNTDLDALKIWEPFYVGEESRNKALSGSGLGLSIVKKIAEQYDYSLQCVLEEREISFIIKFPMKSYLSHDCKMAAVK